MYVSVHPNWSNNKESVGGASLMPVALHPRARLEHACKFWLSSHHIVYVIEDSIRGGVATDKFAHHHSETQSQTVPRQVHTLFSTQYICTSDESKSHYVQAQQSEGTRVPAADFLICNADYIISASLHLSDRLTITPRYSSKCVQYDDLRPRIRLDLYYCYYQMCSLLDHVDIMPPT